MFPATAWLAKLLSMHKNHVHIVEPCSFLFSFIVYCIYLRIVFVSDNVRLTSTSYNGFGCRFYNGHVSITIPKCIFGLAIHNMPISCLNVRNMHLFITRYIYEFHYDEAESLEMLFIRCRSTSCLCKHDS